MVGILFILMSVVVVGGLGLVVVEVRVCGGDLGLL